MHINQQAGNALKGRWKAGMKCEYPSESVVVRIHAIGSTADPYCSAFAINSNRPFNMLARYLADPCMTDPATRGAYLDVVCEAWKAFRPDASIHVFVWWAEDYHPGGGPSGATQDAGFVLYVVDTSDYGNVLWKPPRTSPNPETAMVVALESAPVIEP